MKNYIVVSSETEALFFSNLKCNASILTAEEYLNESINLDDPVRVFNLCNDYSYCKRGYYVSLLAEARKHRPLPNITNITDLQNRDSLKVLSESLSSSLNKVLKEIKTEDFEISVYFGKNTAQKYTTLSKQIFYYVQSPLLRVFCQKREDQWVIKGIRPIAFNEVPKNHYEFLAETIIDFFGHPQTIRKPKQNLSKYDLAILLNPQEEIPPSNKGAIKGFMDAAKDLRIHVECIEPKDIGLLSRFDALFIRETTSVFNHTYRFSKRAELEGLIVIDDPLSILRCCNKIYLHDLLSNKKLATPATHIIHRGSDLSRFTEYPLVLKKPDSAFSAGVKKVNNLDELTMQAEEFFIESDLLVLQEYLHTDFDWRIGIIDNEPLYACRYFMARNHWQIINRVDGKTTEGAVETLALDEVPSAIIKLAQKACKEIGNSLYGVDIKEKDGQYYLIEINDNPNIDKGSEDKVLGSRLYSKIMSVFLRRLENR